MQLFKNFVVALKAIKALEFCTKQTKSAHKALNAI